MMNKLIFILYLVSFVLNSCTQNGKESVNLKNNLKTDDSINSKNEIEKKTIGKTNQKLSSNFTNNIIVPPLKINDKKNINKIVDLCVEEAPEFEGGEDNLFKYLISNIHYPHTAIDDSIQGKVFISFDVLTDGSIDKVTVRRGIRYDLDEVCTGIIRTMPKWKPGKIMGKISNISMTIPITFKLDSNIKTNGVTIIPKIERNNKIKIRLFPNPATTFFRIDLPEIPTDCEYQIITMSGKLIKQDHLYSDKNTIDINDLNQGFYFIKINSQKLKINQIEKLMKDK